MPSPLVKTSAPGFWSFASFPVMLYLASAVTALIGVAQIVVPIHDKPQESLEVFRCLIALNVYELLVLAAALMIVLWKNVTDDATSLVVIIVCFIVGSATAIDVIAPAEPFAAVCFGVSGALLALGKFYALGERIVGRWDPPRIAALAILVLWNFAMPGLLGFERAAQISGTTDVDAPIILLWNFGLFLPILAAIVAMAGLHWTASPVTPAPAPRRVVMDAQEVSDADSSEPESLPPAAPQAREPEAAPEPVGAPPADDEPFLRSNAMRWILLALALAASFVHAYAMSWAVGLNLDETSVFVGLVVSLLMVIEVRRIMGCRLTGVDQMLAIFPAGALFFLLVSGSVETGLHSSWPSHPPVALLGMAVALAAMSLRADRHALRGAAATCGSLGLLALLGPELVAQGKAVDWVVVVKVVGVLVTLGLWSVAIVRRSLAWACAAAVPTTAILYRLFENHAGWATMLLSVLLLGLGAAASVQKGNRRNARV